MRSVNCPPSSCPTYPGGEPMSFETECFSIYSDMSKRINARSLPKRNCASERATSVLPTPVGPKKRNEPTGRSGFFRPARERRMVRAPSGGKTHAACAREESRARPGTDPGALESA